MRRSLAFAAAAVALIVAGFPALAPPLSAPLPRTVFLEEMTWVEVRAALADGRTTAIVPTGGLEQGGPHLVLGKHNYILRETSRRIAEALGNALVAPTLAYVPEGDIEPPTQNMAWPGTISVPQPVFEAVLEAAARSLRTHGFTLICFVGDNGLNQEGQQAVADRLNREWRGSGARVLHVGDYYSAANGQVDWLRGQGESDHAIGWHAGIRDTSELLAAFPDGVRVGRIADGGGWSVEPTGVVGDPTRASAERGAVLLQLKVDAALRQIRAAAAGS